MLRHEFGMLPQPVAGSFDLHDDGMMQQSVEQCRRDDRVAKDIAPFCKTAV
ncbi:hypothetical protein D3C72_1745210 [compost metagenome]